MQTGYRHSTDRLHLVLFQGVEAAGQDIEVILGAVFRYARYRLGAFLVLAFSRRNIR